MPAVPKNDDPWLPKPDEITGLISLQRNATPIQVCRYKPSQTGSGDPIFILDNVVAQTVRYKLGTDPGSARLRYRFTGLDPQAPQSIEQALSSGTVLPKTVLPNDRILIRALRPDGKWIPFFDGYVMGEGFAIDRARETVTMTCLGIAKICDHYPIPGAIMRQGDKLLIQDNSADIATDNLAVFNPKGKPNCIPDAAWNKNNNSGKGYPIFIDPENTAPDPNQPTYWTLAKAARYLIFLSQQYNPDESILKFPTGAQLDSALIAKLPINQASFDPNDPTTYTTAPIIVPDKPITGKNWMSVLNDLISGKGFACRWYTGPSLADPQLPQTELQIFHLEDNEPKDIWLQKRGSDLDPFYSNTASAQADRDLTEVANEWEVQGSLTQHEVSWVLTPGFTNGVGSITTDFLESLIKTSSQFTLELKDLFRLWLLDESGEGHYTIGGTTVKKDVPNLDGIFGKPINDNPQYCNHRRVPKGTLVTTDPAGQPIKWRASISTDYQADGGQAIVPVGTPTAGTFTLTFRTNTTAAISAVSTTAAAVKTALESLASIGTGNVVTTGGPFPSPILIFATGTLAGQAIEALTLTPTGVSGSTLTVSVQADGGQVVPGPWDGTSGNWQPISGGIQLLKDRVGIAIDAPNPNAWQIGKGLVYPTGVVRAVEALKTPSITNKKYVIRLTCVVESDKRVKGEVTRQLNNVLTQKIRRTIDAHDRYTKTIVSQFSEYSEVAADEVFHDDTDAAQAEAVTVQLATQNGVLGGRYVIPYFTLNYTPGRRIRGMQGRGLGFRTDNGGTQAAPTYPAIEEVSIQLEGQQRVEYSLSDANTNRHSYTARVRRHHDRRNR